MDLEREVNPEVVDGLGGGEGVGAVLVGVGYHVTHAKSVDGGDWEVNVSEDDDLAIGRQLGESSDDP